MMLWFLGPARMHSMRISAGGDRTGWSRGGGLWCPIAGYRPSRRRRPYLRKPRRGRTIRPFIGSSNNNLVLHLDPDIFVSSGSAGYWTLRRRQSRLCKVRIEESIPRVACDCIDDRLILSPDHRRDTGVAQLLLRNIHDGHALRMTPVITTGLMYLDRIVAMMMRRGAPKRSLICGMGIINLWLRHNGRLVVGGRRFRYGDLWAGCKYSARPVGSGFISMAGSRRTMGVGRWGPLKTPPYACPNRGEIDGWSGDVTP